MLVEVVIKFSSVIRLPTIGIIPVGSGEVRSLNHKRPSVVSAGLSLYANANLLINDIHVIWRGSCKIPASPSKG